MNIDTEVRGFLMRRFRPQRARKIGADFPLLFDPNARVLDVGGGAFPWSELKPKAKIYILNKGAPPSKPVCCCWEFVDGDGTNLQYPDASFDLVFSNSVIEHVGSLDEQKKFAKEMQRVGKRIYLQTPNKWFPVEPHLMGVFIHWLPFPVARKLVRVATGWGWLARPNQERVDSFLSSIRLLTKSEVVSLFPNCELSTENVLWFAKSFIVKKL